MKSSEKKMHKITLTVVEINKYREILVVNFFIRNFETIRALSNTLGFFYNAEYRILRHKRATFCVANIRIL